MKRNSVIRALAAWLALSFVLTLAAGISYFTMQQTLRQSANWPQAQMAQDAAVELAAGKPADAIVSNEKIDISTAQASFIIVYDVSGNVLASSAALNGADPKLPKGVLDCAAQQGEDRVTWMPGGGVRIAAVVEKAQGGAGGFVLAGRSLRETERSIDNIGRLLLAAWAGGEALLLVSSLLIALFLKKKPNPVND